MAFQVELPKLTKTKENEEEIGLINIEAVEIKNTGELEELEELIVEHRDIDMIYKLLSEDTTLEEASSQKVLHDLILSLALSSLQQSLKKSRTANSGLSTWKWLIF